MVVITIWCSLSVVQSRPRPDDTVDVAIHKLDTDDTVDVAIHKHKTPAEESQQKKKNIVKKADLEDYDYAASSKIVKRVNVPDDGPGAAPVAYGYAGVPHVAQDYPY